jgi:hypothetical protein
MNYQPEVVGYNLSAYVKVQTLPPPSSKKINATAFHIGVPVLVAVVCLLILMIRRTILKRMEEDDPFKGVAGMPTSAKSWDKEDSGQSTRENLEMSRLLSNACVTLAMGRKNSWQKSLPLVASIILILSD